MFRVLVVFVLLAVSMASVHLPERASGGSFATVHKLGLQSSSSDSNNAMTWNAPIDHFSNNSTATFKQRYFVDSQYFMEGTDAPVFFEIGGEGTLGGPPGGFIADLAKEHGALLVALEHRFYGESIPNDCSHTENLKKHLTVEQALADLNSFTHHYTKEKNLKGKWFVFGGSYPGALSSWYRNAYPEASVGSLSSSGVVNPIVDYYQFDEAVSAAIGNECGARLKKISRAFEKSVELNFNEAKEQMHCEADIGEVDYLYMLADSWSMADQYGKKSALCDAIMAAPEHADDKTLTQTFADFSIDYWGAGFCSAGFYNTKALADPARWDVNSRSWRFQTCYQVAWFNTAPAQGSIRSARVDLDYHLKQCEEIFGYKMEPAVEPLIKKFGGDQPNPVHNVFYSDFSDDPWRTASVQYPVAVDQPYHLAMCNDCGHCADFHAPAASDPPQLTEGREEFAKFVKKWLA